MNRKSMVVKFQGNFVLGASSPVCFKLKSFDSPARAVWRMQVERSNSLLNSKLESDLFVSLQATRTSPASRGMVEARHRNAAVTLTKDSPGEYQQRLPAFRRYRPADMSRKPLVL